MNKVLGSFTGAWASCPWLHPWRTMTLPPPVVSNCQGLLSYSWGLGNPHLCAGIFTHLIFCRSCAIIITAVSLCGQLWSRAQGTAFCSPWPCHAALSLSNPAPLAWCPGCTGRRNVDVPFATEHSITLLFLKEAKACLPPSKMQF